MILLDTHVVLWLALEPGKIPKPAASAIRKQRKTGSGLSISCISLYEISRVFERGRIALDVPLETFLGKVNALFEIKPVNADIAMTAARLPNRFPGDPADRIIAATAIVEGLSLITADGNIRRSRAVKTIW